MLNISQFYLSATILAATMVINGGSGIIYAYSIAYVTNTLMAGSILIPVNASYASTLAVNGGTVTYSELR